MPIGAAAGLAAAFNTPIAAVTFTLEEILGDTAGKPMGSIVIAAVIASVIERAILGDHSIFSVPAYRLNDATELISYAVLGVVAGLAALVFSDGLLGLRAFFKKQQSVPQWATPAVGGLLLGAIGLAALLMTNSSSVFGVGYGQLSTELQSSFPLKVVIILGTLKLAATITSYGSGSSGGIFGPSLYVGGMIGGAVGIITHLVTGNPLTQPGAFALVGMGAAFAGIVRAPVTSIVIIFEMTNNYSIILPLMVANIISYALATRIRPTPIYDALLAQDGVHLPHTERHLLKRVPVRAAMTRNVITVGGLLTVDEAFKYLQEFAEHHHAYPVVEDGDRLIGLSTFNDLKRAIADGRSSHLLKDVAARRMIHVDPDQTLDVALLKLGRNGISQLPVVSRRNSSRLLGMITLHDIAEALSGVDDQIHAVESTESVGVQRNMSVDQTKGSP